MNEELLRSHALRKWPVKLFECCEYRDIKVSRLLFDSHLKVLSLPS
jgi:hypothetical protein